MPASNSQRELTRSSPLLNSAGDLSQVGWARRPVLDCNLESANIYRSGPLAWLLRPFQRFRIKRWDYYGITTPSHFFSVTLADLGYAGQAFVYLVDFAGRRYHEESITVPLGRGVSLSRNSTSGESTFDNGRVRLAFHAETAGRRVSVQWPGFGGQDLSAELLLRMPLSHESTVVVIPIRDHRFYYNRKINCLPVEGRFRLGQQCIQVRPNDCLGNLDWGRGVWEYRSFWVWASASGFVPGLQIQTNPRPTIGLNLGFGFGDTSAATENTILLDGCIHKLGQVDFSYDRHDFMRPWAMQSPDGRLDLEFVPFLERVAKTNLGPVASEVHQMFGRYRGEVTTDRGHVIPIDNLIGFAEEHQARW